MTPPHRVPTTTDTYCLDGGLATELIRSGRSFSSRLGPNQMQLTEEARRSLRAVHDSYLAAGADVISTNTFRANLRYLKRAGLQDAGLAWMVQAAVGVATSARNEFGSRRALVAGSMAPVEDCYQPALVPSDEELRAEHLWMANELVNAGVDIVLIETMNTIREARIAVEQVRSVGGRAWVSFVAGPDGALLSGEPLVDGVRAVADGAEIVLINCTPTADTEHCLQMVREVHDGPIGAYPNNEDRQSTKEAEHGPPPAAMDPVDFAATLARWVSEFDLAAIGGCCGAGPEHISAIKAALAPASALPTAELLERS